MNSGVPKQNEIDVLKSELVGLFKHIQKIRVEIAMIKSPKTDQFASMTDELDSIIDSTSSATEEIMSNVERINDIAFSLSDKLKADSDRALVDEVIDRVTNVIVACSFQDITGQRIQKVVKAVKYIERRINRLIDIWGQDVIYEQKVEEQTETDEYKKYLHGPQLKGQGVSQSQVDEMLSKGGPAPAQSQPQQNQAPQPPVQKVAEAPKVAPQTQKAPKPQVQAPPKKEPEPETSGKPLDQSSIDSLFD